MTGRRLCWLLLPLLVAALALETGRAARLLKASRILAIVKRTTVEASQRGALSGQLVFRNLELLRQAEAANPMDVALPIARGGQFLLLKRPKAAIRAYRQALEIEQRGETYALLGRAYLQAGDLEAARSAFQLAVQLDRRQRRRLQGLWPRPPAERSQPRRDGSGRVFSNTFDPARADSVTGKPKGEQADD